jgi:hypothetical protein
LGWTNALDRVIKTCLEKNPDRRFQNALDLKRALVWAMETTEAAALGKVRMPSLVVGAGMVAALMAVVAGIALWAPWRSDKSADLPLTRRLRILPDSDHLCSSEADHPFSLDPDQCSPAKPISVLAMLPTQN